MRDAAFKKENLRLQRKVFTQQAKIASLENELLLRPAYAPPKADGISVDDLNKFLETLPAKQADGGHHAA